MKASDFALFYLIIFLIYSNSFIHGEPQMKLTNQTKLDERREFLEKFDGFNHSIEGWPKSVDYTNYIIVYYGTNTNYPKGFLIDYDGEVIPFRNNVNYIMSGTSNLTSTQPLNIAADAKIEIYFSSPPKSLENFFHSFEDEKVKNIKSVDLSHLDVTSLTSFQSTFWNCKSLESVIGPKFPSFNLETMMGMFGECSSLLSIDLFNFFTDNVNDTIQMFGGCNALKVIKLFILYRNESINDIVYVILEPLAHLCTSLIKFILVAVRIIFF